MNPEPPKERRGQVRNLYSQADWRFRQLLALPHLDEAVDREPRSVSEFESGLDHALATAFDPDELADARLFLQRVLYRIYRLRYFWFDSMSNYANEESDYLSGIRKRIEYDWQRWESSQCPVRASSGKDPRSALVSRILEDRDPPATADTLFIQECLGAAGYRRLLEIRSLEGLAESSQLTRVLAGLAHPVQSVLTKIAFDEYGNGYLRTKHSVRFRALLEEHALETAPEAYFDSIPWPVLAAITYSFLVSERRRHYLRFIGGLLFSEVSMNATLRPISAAARRLGFNRDKEAYWALHSESQPRCSLEELALPLTTLYPHDAWELLWGYDQQRFISARAFTATVQACRIADRLAELSPQFRPA